jgi:hypothetical protein
MIIMKQIVAIKIAAYLHHGITLVHQTRARQA